ncbi:long-chain-fatty-acid--CoA ligase 4-like [Oppia nitens]|uniref:long-chain-fatty-acid--CoA ligase 4-like n=1 Tax=Oppia nitens TaxID=1686743 RepID=UPI0023D9E81D|nr:long-chain-fatty-acid--CoA ligase 4-like [Oppia nitens]
MSKLLVNLFMLKTRLIVNTYTVTTLPLYYAIQKPWRTLKEANQVKTKKFVTKNGELVWERNHPSPEHEFLKYSSYAEVLKHMPDQYSDDRIVLGKRDVIKETVEMDENGNIVKVDGKVLRKFVLSDSYKWMTLKEMMQRVDNIAKGLVKFGVKKGDKVVIWADTRLEWSLCSLAIMKINATLTTLFSNLGTPGLIYGINQTEATTIITTIDLLPKLKSFLKDVPNVKSIIYIKNPKDVFNEEFPEDIAIKSVEQLEELGAENKNVISFDLPKNPDEIAVIMYTSGTTGNPKAVCISHRQLMASLKALVSNTTEQMARDADRHVYMSYLPLAHILGFTFEMFLLFGGVRIGYSSPFTLTDSSPGHVSGQVGDARLLKPSSMTAVPLVLDRIYKEIYDKLNARTPISAPLFTYLMEYKIRWKTRGYDTPIINRLFCKKVSEAVGGQLEYIMVGGAALNPRTQSILKAAFNMKQVVQGYGATETCGGVMGMYIDDLTYNRIGIPFEGAKIKLVDWKEGGYLTGDQPNPRGEIVVGSDIVALGYYKAPELTAEAFVTDSDGVRWFYTGDIAEVFPNGSFQIIDRKKDLAKLSNGEFISLGKIEALLKSCSLVENVCAVANSDRNCVIALVTPNQKALINLGKQLDKPRTYTRDQLCNDSDVCDKTLESIQTTAQLSGLKRIETPIKVKLCPEEWTVDNNLITAAFKLKRNVVMTYYKKEINEMFDSLK